MFSSPSRAASVLLTFRGFSLPPALSLPRAFFPSPPGIADVKASVSPLCVGLGQVSKGVFAARFLHGKATSLPWRPLHGALSCWVDIRRSNRAADGKLVWRGTKWGEVFVTWIVTRGETVSGFFAVFWHVFLPVISFHCTCENEYATSEIDPPIFFLLLHCFFRCICFSSYHFICLFFVKFSLRCTCGYEDAPPEIDPPLVSPLNSLIIGAVINLPFFSL